MIRFGTKAETLIALRQIVTRSKVCESYVFTVNDWQLRSNEILKAVRSELRCDRVIIRSSALSEDSIESAQAGVFDSVADVPIDSHETLSVAIQQVVQSFKRASTSDFGENQVLVQPMISGVSMSGVLFTHDLNTGAPYYVINYDDTSGKTDTVTSGKDQSRTLLIHRGHIDQLSSTRFKKLLAAVVEIEAQVHDTGLDIEFAVTHDEEIYIFQVRPLAVQKQWNPEVVRQVDSAIREIRRFLDVSFEPAHGVLGRRSIFGEMSDWNPAEMIGAAPSALALSLYSHLITDSVWAEARGEMGYRDLRGSQLMVSLAGKPYIDVRKSFNSFLPAKLSDEIGDKCVNFWCDKLERSPELHDKIEFEVATTVYTPDFLAHTESDRLQSGLSDGEYVIYGHTLFEFSDQLISNSAQLIEEQYQRTRIMEVRRIEALNHAKKYPMQDLSTAQQLLADCREYGTKPFSILARLAFIAEEFLRSFQRTSTLKSDRVLLFRRSIKTVLTDFLEKVRLFQIGMITREEFLREYGHLRPGTYDILSTRYDQRSDFLASSNVSVEVKTNLDTDEAKSFEWTKEETHAVDRTLKEAGFRFDSKHMFQFMRDAIAGREFAKLKFTQNISDSIEILAEWGRQNGLSREQLSHLRVDEILSSVMAVPVVSAREYFLDLSERSKKVADVTRSIRLPYLIRSLSDVHIVPLLKSRPNFIGLKSIEAEVTALTGKEKLAPLLDGRIVLIEGADPGFDWIFMSKIAGLITKYGGSNSHMAIRCAELGIPAAIGCGEQIFNACIHSNRVSLDCASGLIIPTS